MRVFIKKSPIKFLEKQEQAKPKSSRWKEIMKMRTEIDKMETKGQHKESMKQKNWFFEKISKINNP
jgi:hypothetical protein